MLHAYRDNNEDVGFKYFHVFKRIETCEKWILTRAELYKTKEGGFALTVATPVAVEGRPIGNKAAKEEWAAALAVEWLQSSIEKCITHAAVREANKANVVAAREEKADARWSTMVENQEVNIGLVKDNVTTKKQEKYLSFLMASTSTMDVETRAWYNKQRAMIFHEKAAPPATATSTTPTAMATITTPTLTEEAPSTSADPTTDI
ncbi:hypothetical protein ACQ4PT_032516 [Festuca glaucescens]